MAELSPRCLRCIDVLFRAEDRDRAKAALREGLKNHALESERCQLAALKISDGDFSKLEHAINLARIDFRDLLMAADFGNSLSAHLTWEPKPADEPAEINAPQLAASIQRRIGALLTPLGFERHEGEWQRHGEVRQTLRLLTGLTSRVETRFFLRLILEAKPIEVMLQLPRLPAGPAKLSVRQGYIFRAGDSEAALLEAVASDVAGLAYPWFERFTTAAELQRGFADRTFHPSLKAKDQVILF